MASNKSKANLEAELDEAQDYIEQLEGKLDDIVGIAGDSEEDSEDDSDSDSDDDTSDESRD